MFFCLWCIGSGGEHQGRLVQLGRTQVRLGPVQCQVAVEVGERGFGRDQTLGGTDGFCWKLGFIESGDIRILEKKFGWHLEEDGTMCMSPRKYIEKLLGTYKHIFSSKPKQNVTSPLEKGDHPELDMSEEGSSTESCQSSIAGSMINYVLVHSTSVPLLNWCDSQSNHMFE